jgi:hypothetical protein
VSGLAYLVVAVGMAVVLSTLLWLVRRKPRSFMSSIEAFRREMDALAGGPRPPAERGGGPARRPAAGDRRARRRLEPIIPAPGPGDLARKLRAARQHDRQHRGRRPDRER